MRKVNMLEGSLKSIFIFAVPMMLSSLLQHNYAIVDNIIVGRYVSPEALAAVGNIGSINPFIIGTALGLTSGFTIPAAQAYGAGELIGRIVIALVLTPKIGFSAICYAAPAAWLMADIPLFIIYLIKNKKFKRLALEQKQKSFL